MFSVTRNLRNQAGFSMAEVVMATLIFVASVVGISGMLISGGANIRVGASESTAANLASRRLEEVKSIPFYKPWDPSIGSQDIDDYYFNLSQPNGYGGSLSEEEKHPQLDNPSVVEEYGTIPGFSKFKRTTAIEYQYVSSLGGNQHFAPAVMCATSPYSWVPNRPGDGQTDVPRGGADLSVSSELQAIVVEVCVYYRDNNGQRVYKERALVGQLTTAGATNTPFLLIQSINPTTGDWGTTHMDMDIYVKATAPPFGSGAQLDVRLWRTGSTDVVANNPVASGDGSKISCWFDLTNPNITIGIPYNISVYWKDGGWQDVFRNCFTVGQYPPTISGISNFNWAYAKQTARQVTITGNHLLSPTSVILKGPNPENTYQVNGSVVSSSTTQIVVNFNISSTTTTANSRWDVMVTTGGGTATSDSDDKRVWMNPPPRITAITSTSSPDYYDWGYRAQTSRAVRIEGEYLCGLDQIADTSTTLKYGSYQTSKALFGSAPVSNNLWEYNTPVKMTFSPSSAGAGADTNNTRWKVRVANYGGSDETDASPGESVLMNPPPTITGFSGLGSPATANTGYASGSGAAPPLPSGTSYKYSGLSVTGTYLQDNSTVYFVRSGGSPPSSGNTYVALTNGTTQANGESVTGLKMPVNVNDDSGDGNSFKQWSGSSDASNDYVNGTYYLNFKNSDEQTYFASGIQATVNHAQYTLSLARSIPDGLGYSADTYGTVSGGGSTYWQDQVSGTITATPTANHKLFKWTNATGATISTSPSCTVRVTSSTATAWFWKKLYWGPDNANANVEGNFVKGYDSGSGTEFNALDTADGYNLHVHAWDTSNTNREIAGVTSSTLDFTGVNKVRIEWKQTKSGAYADLVVHTANNNNKDSYTKRLESTSSFARSVSDLTATGLGNGYYVRVHAKSAGSWFLIFWTDRPSEVRVYRIWLE